MTADPVLRVRGWCPGLLDVAVAFVVVALGVRVLASAGGGGGFRSPDSLGYALTATGCAATAWARRQPLAALAVVGLVGTVLAVRDAHVDVLPFVVTGLLFMLANLRAVKVASLGLAITMMFWAVTVATAPADLAFPQVVLSTAIFAAAWALGLSVRSRRSALLALVSEAEGRASAERELADVERDRSRLAMVEERLRIARDVHDVLSHSMSVVSVQATVGAHLSIDDPVAARQALLTISDVSRSSMQELRHMLTLLRDDSTTPDENVTYEPAQGIDTLETLLDTYRAAGLPVITTAIGTPRTLTASVELCVYRIVQEALTNTLKHAGSTTATVGLNYTEPGLEVLITDDGRGPGPSSGGHGLIGMAERVALLGGRLHTGAGTAGGFCVAAMVPYGNDMESVSR